jgi:hypothetical protein
MLLSISTVFWQYVNEEDLGSGEMHHIRHLAHVRNKKALPNTTETLPLNTLHIMTTSMQTCLACWYVTTSIPLGPPMIAILITSW